MTYELSEPIRRLIVEEQQRQPGEFITGVDFDGYLAKLGEKAEILAHLAPDHCRGFVAFYCNDLGTLSAYITLVLVHPDDRTSGLGRTLVTTVIAIAKARGFRTCQLEVAKTNVAANRLYASLDFRVIADRGPKHLLECIL